MPRVRRIDPRTRRHRRLTIRMPMRPLVMVTVMGPGMDRMNRHER
jgi:hypothetical protein